MHPFLLDIKNSFNHLPYVLISKYFIPFCWFLYLFIFYFVSYILLFAWTFKNVPFWSLPVTILLHKHHLLHHFYIFYKSLSDFQNVFKFLYTTNIFVCKTQKGVIFLTKLQTLFSFHQLFLSQHSLLDPALHLGVRFPCLFWSVTLSHSLCFMLLTLLNGT